MTKELTMRTLLSATLLLLVSTAHADTLKPATSTVNSGEEAVRYTATLEDSPEVKLKAEMKRKQEAEKADREALEKINHIKTIKELTWNIQKGDTLRQGLNKWVNKAGWNYLAWQSSKEFPIVVDINVHGSFQEAISVVLKAYHRSGNPLYACLKQGNKVLVIADKPLNDECYSSKTTSEGK